MKWFFFFGIGFCTVCAAVYFTELFLYFLLFAAFVWIVSKL